MRQYFSLPVDLAAKFIRAALLYNKALVRSDSEADLSWVWGVGVIETLAEVPGDHEGVMGRFSRLIMAHLPAPPAERPPQFQLEWGAELKKPFEKIYGYRSDFLHAGHPFPPPMTHPPQSGKTDSGRPWFAERPFGVRGFGGAMYERESSPMNLHIFLHIVREVALKWLEFTSKTAVAPFDAFPDPPLLQVKVSSANNSRLRIIVTDEDGDVVKDEKIPSVDLIPSPLKEFLPDGYEVSEIFLSKSSAEGSGQQSFNQADKNPEVESETSKSDDTRGKNSKM